MAMISSAVDAAVAKRDMNSQAIAAGELRVHSGSEWLPAERCRAIHRLMVLARIMEERMIKMSKSGQAYFWVGGPGEEAFNVCLGLQVKRGQGPAYDFLHFHYRNSATMLAMGMEPIDAIRQIAMTATAPFSMGRNFVGHFARREWNVTPVFSVIENQYVIAPGTALMQRRFGGDGISIVTGGDAGTAEGDFASCLTWATRPGMEAPVLIIVTDNGWGISTRSASQFSERRPLDLARAHGIPGEIVDGNDPISSWHAIQRATEYCRRERGPYMLEARVSRLYGHSSSSGAMRVREEADCLDLFEKKLIEKGILTTPEVDSLREQIKNDIEAAVEQTMREPRPKPEDVKRFTFAPSPVDAVYPEDYHGLPR